MVLRKCKFNVKNNNNSQNKRGVRIYTIFTRIIKFIFEKSNIRYYLYFIWWKSSRVNIF